MKNLLKALVCSVMLMIVSIVLVSPSQSVLAVTTTANIFVDPSFNGAEFDAKTSIEVPVTIVKYDMYDRGRYYIDVMNKDGKVVASDHGSLTDLIVGTTNLTVFWNYSNKPHELGDYTVRYYTTNDTGGTVSFKVSSLSGTCGSKLNWTVKPLAKVKKNSTVKKSVNLTYSWKTYYVQIRSYKKVSGGYNYSTWSSTKILKGEY